MYIVKEKSYSISGWAIQERNIVDITHERPPYMDESWEGLVVKETDFIKWQRGNWNWLPEDEEGVYIIYDKKGSPIYIGTTANNKGFRGRLRNHHKKQYFSLTAEYIKMYYINDPTGRLLFERIKIHQLEPILNRDFKHSLHLTDKYQDQIRNEHRHCIETLESLGVEVKVIDDIIQKHGLKGAYEKIEELEKGVK